MGLRWLCPKRGRDVASAKRKDQVRQVQDRNPCLLERSRFPVQTLPFASFSAHMYALRKVAVRSPKVRPYLYLEMQMRNK
jgi:hypothetical protein